MASTFDIIHAVDDQELPLAVGMFLSSSFTGGLITLGILCVFLLSAETGGSPKRRRLLRIYIIALLLAVVAFELAYFLTTNFYAIFYPHSTEE